ncbi:MAG: DciA family protein [Alphaproteobacteria bacterium]|jgi:hypothetical protein|nr:DciA family protein [Alphaproteobacteria bacterium]|tara:strand:- start:1124 stop:1585 length:462 start_codon:yes stop_codon:yes gene_type:complete
MPMARQTRPLASALHKVTEKIYRKRGFASAGVIDNWPAIVGEELARHTSPERLGGDGTLRLRVDGPLATEIKHMEPQILERIAGYFGYRAVNRLALIQAPLEKPPPQEPAVVRILDSDSAKTLAETIDGTRSADIKSALARLGKAVLSRPRDG